MLGAGPEPRGEEQGWRTPAETPTSMRAASIYLSTSGEAFERLHRGSSHPHVWSEGGTGVSPGAPASSTPLKAMAVPRAVPRPCQDMAGAKSTGPLPAPSTTHPFLWERPPRALPLPLQASRWTLGMEEAVIVPAEKCHRHAMCGKKQVCRAWALSLPAGVVIVVVWGPKHSRSFQITWEGP